MVRSSMVRTAAAARSDDREANGARPTCVVADAPGPATRRAVLQRQRRAATLTALVSSQRCLGFETWRTRLSFHIIPQNVVNRYRENLTTRALSRYYTCAPTC